jgi:hypothetical protein
MVEARAVVEACGILPQPVLIHVRLGKKLVRGDFSLGAARLALGDVGLGLEVMPHEAVALAIRTDHSLLRHGLQNLSCTLYRM